MFETHDSGLKTCHRCGWYPPHILFLKLYKFLCNSLLFEFTIYMLMSNGTCSVRCPALQRSLRCSVLSISPRDQSWPYICRAHYQQTGSLEPQSTTHALSVDRYFVPLTQLWMLMQCKVCGPVACVHFVEGTVCCYRVVVHLYYSNCRTYVRVCVCPLRHQILKNEVHSRNALGHDFSCGRQRVYNLCSVGSTVVP